MILRIVSSDAFVRSLEVRCGASKSTNVKMMVLAQPCDSVVLAATAKFEC